MQEKEKKLGSKKAAKQYCIDMFDMDEELLNEIINKKNDEIEIPYNEKGYSTDELDELILSTNVYIES